jgi:NAD(P)H-dependent FMN reductase
MNNIRDVAVIVGSLRKESINRKVANALVELVPPSLKLSIIEIGHCSVRSDFLLSFQPVSHALEPRQTIRLFPLSHMLFANN